MVRNNHRRTLKMILGGLFGLAILGYGYFEARYFLEGPQIEIATPVNASTVSDSFVTVSGTAKNISFLTLNDRQIFVDRDGNFNEKLLLYPGYTIIKIKAKDRFGRVAEKDTEVVLAASS